MHPSLQSVAISDSFDADISRRFALIQTWCKFVKGIGTTEVGLMTGEEFKTINMDFAERVVIDTNDRDWIVSPMEGVWRKPLAREEAERGHATSIVRYDPGSRFAEHGHPLGEEIFVLEGTFSDETGDYQAGTYFRNPDGFRHAPFSDEGTVILVKLHRSNRTMTRMSSSIRKPRIGSRSTMA